MQNSYISSIREETSSQLILTICLHWQFGDNAINCVKFRLDQSRDLGSLGAQTSGVSLGNSSQPQLSV
jgi:hypothetical protein